MVSPRQQGYLEPEVTTMAAYVGGKIPPLHKRGPRPKVCMIPRKWVSIDVQLPAERGCNKVAHQGGILLSFERGAPKLPCVAFSLALPQFERHGFNGPLNYYRALDLGWENTAGLKAPRLPISMQM